MVPDTTLMRTLAVQTAPPIPMILFGMPQLDYRSIKDGSMHIGGLTSNKFKTPPLWRHCEKKEKKK
jgi:hypothetical protein